MVFLNGPAPGTSHVPLWLVVVLVVVIGVGFALKYLGRQGPF
jgi:hypothetical protein